ncbi:MAG TPA: hypothetical protein DCL86_04200, partial [Bacteroidales bacterium]|nr:hypothetical protein [Bacteroidales bacterium]
MGTHLPSLSFDIMKIRYYFFFAILIFGFQPELKAQKCKADRLFNRYEYARSIPYYTRVAGKNGRHAVYAMVQAADAHRLTSNFQEAAKWYAKAIENGTTNNMVWLNYGQALRSMGRYTEAAEQFRKYAQLNPSDPRGELYAKYSTEIQQWGQPEYNYTLFNAEAINTPYSEFSPVYLNDGVVFTSDRMTKSGEKRFGWTQAYYLDLWFASLSKINPDIPAVPESPALYSSQLSQPYHDGPATFSKDGKTMYYTLVERKAGDLDSSRYYTNKLKIFSSTFTNDKWSEPIAFFLNNDAWSVGHPALSDDANTLYFVSDMPGGNGGTDIYSVTRNGDGWENPVNLGSTVNTFGNEMFPFSYQDSILYFSSDGHAGLGSLDIFKTSKKGAFWSKPENLKAPINSPADDFGYVINAQGTEAMLSSNRPGGKGEDDIYMVSIAGRLPEFVMLEGVVKNQKTAQPLINSHVFALDLSSNEVRVLKTNDAGHFHLQVPAGSKMVIKGMKSGYAPDCQSVTLETGSKADYFTVADLLLSAYTVDQIFKLENIYYDFNKWDIRPDAAAELEKVVTFLNENPDITVELGSHTDARGSDKYNEKLSERRAVSAVEYIVSKGINAKRITAKGYGEQKLVNHCGNGVECSDEEHQQNRRTEIKITGTVQEVDATLQQPLDIYQDNQTLELKDFKVDFFN